jgi:hypothetical protein
VLEEEGTARIAKLTLAVTSGPGPSCVPVTVRFEDGFQGAGIPIENIVSFSPGISQKPLLTECSFLVCPPAAGLQLSGDANQDGKLDLSDLFRGASPPVLGAAWTRIPGCPDVCEEAP